MICFVLKKECLLVLVCCINIKLIDMRVYFFFFILVLMCSIVYIMIMFELFILVDKCFLLIYV